MTYKAEPWTSGAVRCEPRSLMPEELKHAAWSIELGSSPRATWECTAGHYPVWLHRFPPSDDVDSWAHATQVLVDQKTRVRGTPSRAILTLRKDYKSLPGLVLEDPSTWPSRTTDTARGRRQGRMAPLKHVVPGETHRGPFVVFEDDRQPGAFYLCHQPLPTSWDNAVESCLAIIGEALGTETIEAGIVR